MAASQQTDVKPNHATEYNKVRAELAVHLAEKTKLATGLPFDEIDCTRTFSPIPAADLERIHVIDHQIASCYLRMREIIRMQRE